MRSFLLELRCRSSLLVFCSFLFEQRWGKCFVELAWLNFLFGVGLAQFFVGAALSDFPVRLSQFFCLSGGGENVLLSSCGQQRFCSTLGLIA